MKSHKQFANFTAVAFVMAATLTGQAQTLQLLLPSPVPNSAPTGLGQDLLINPFNSSPAPGLFLWINSWGGGGDPSLFRLTPTDAASSSFTMEPPIYGSEDAWELAWMRYGIGDWRTGWMASPLADMLTATAGGLFTAPFHLDEKATEKPGPWCQRLHLGKRAWRMTTSADGRVLVSGCIVAENAKAQIRNVGSLESPGALLAAIDGANGTVRWKAKPISPPPELPRPPEPTDEFRTLAEEFHFTPFALVPFQAAISVAANRDASPVAFTEYGWLRADWPGADSSQLEPAPSSLAVRGSGGHCACLAPRARTWPAPHCPSKAAPRPAASLPRMAA